VCIEYAAIYNARGYPTIAIVRDIRDVIAELPLPEWVGGEKGLNQTYRHIWRSLHMFDLCLRYEDLVTHPEEAIGKIARVLAYDFKVMHRWNPDSVHHTMFKLDRHEMLRKGAISRSAVGIWKARKVDFDGETLETARTMGY
jgi:hypothetical protein